MGRIKTSVGGSSRAATYAPVEEGNDDNARVVVVAAVLDPKRMAAGVEPVAQLVNAQLVTVSARAVPLEIGGRGYCGSGILFSEHDGQRGRGDLRTCAVGVWRVTGTVSEGGQIAPVLVYSGVHDVASRRARGALGDA